MGDFSDDDEICTVYWECEKCGEPCDPKEESKGEKFYNILEDDPKAIIKWCKEEIKAYKELIKLLGGK